MESGELRIWLFVLPFFQSSIIPSFLFLYAVFLVHVGDAAEERHRFLIAFVAHAVHFHGGDEDEVLLIDIELIDKNSLSLIRTRFRVR
jgi:hypothetical protein